MNKREVVKKHLAEIQELSKICLDENGKFINGYGSKIANIIIDCNQKMFNSVKTITPFNKTGEFDDIFVKLDILYYLLDEEGFTLTNKYITKITDNKWKTEAKNRLFMMFVKRISEINYLLKGGYATAALSITRGIYEIAVYYEIISNNDEDISEKFLKHCNYDRLRLAKSINPGLKNKITKQINKFEYGKDFLNEYGWAASLVNGTINFKRLADLTKLSEIYYLYKYCCTSLHANIWDSLYGVGINENEKGKNIWITTPSNDGIKNVISIMTNFSYGIIEDFIGNGSLETLLITNLFRDILVINTDTLPD